MAIENSKKIDWMAWFLVGALALRGAALMGWRRSPRDSQGGQGGVYAQVGQPAPNIEFALSPGKRTSLQQLHGKAVLVNFWASWCGPCMEEMGSLAALERRFADKPFILIALDADESDEAARIEVAHREMPSHLIFDFSRSSLAAYDVNSIPTSVLIDRRGVVQDIILGPRSWDDAGSLAALDRAMQGP